jgi:hypothetical protein
VAFLFQQNSSTRSESPERSDFSGAGHMQRVFTVAGFCVVRPGFHAVDYLKSGFRNPVRKLIGFAQSQAFG